MAQFDDSVETVPCRSLRANKGGPPGFFQAVVAFTECHKNVLNLDESVTLHLSEQNFVKFFVPDQRLLNSLVIRFSYLGEL